MRGYAALLLVFLALPGASAQALDARLQLSVESPSELLAPDTGVAEHKVTINISCPLHQDPLIPSWRLTWQKVYVEPYATVVMNPSSDKVEFDEAKCVDPAYRVSRSVRVTITNTRDAPAFATFRTQIKATLEQGSISNSTGTNLSTTNGFFPLTQANPDELFLRVQPGESFAFRVELNNLGNGPVHVLTTTQPVGKNHLNYTASPADHILPHKGVSTVILKATAANASGVVNYIASTNARFVSSSLDPRSDLTDETTITFSVQIASFAESPDVPLMTALVAIVLVVARISRRRDQWGP